MRISDWSSDVCSSDLLGPNGPLPLHLTEYARDRLRNARDPTFIRFLDVFNHRMVSLFYRAWASARPTVRYDRPDEDRFAFSVGALFGLAPASFRYRDDMPDLATPPLQARLAAPTRNAARLVGILKASFHFPVALRR